MQSGSGKSAVCVGLFSEKDTEPIPFNRNLATLLVTPDRN